MRQALFVFAALAATAATMALLFLIVPLLGRLLERLQGGWIWIVIGIITVSSAILHLARRERI
ncbi:MAG TPA: hypothetical protein VH331_17860 [Allosphingosinicella sp.]|jgi:hypothetical protein|nr:hypothetical protein [Allosphingosinicella sp.]